MNKREELETTTNSRIYKIRQKECFARCSYCPWHPRKNGSHCENGRWEWYYIYIRDFDPEIDTKYYFYVRIKFKKGMGKYPSWKLVSKNKKQWQGKNLIIKEGWDHKNQMLDDLTTINWKI